MQVYEGEVIWGGSIMGHFGHFLTESVSRLWPLLPGSELEGLPVVFVTPFEMPFVHEWLTAFGAQVVTLPKAGLVRFKRVFVPEPAWRLNTWIAPEIRDIHLHARRGLEVKPVSRSEVLWLSRFELERKRVPYDEGLLEWLLGRHVAVINPQAMTLAEQVAAIEGSTVVAGLVGSAFHSILMASEAPGCVYMCAAKVQSAHVAQSRLLGSSATFVQALAAVGARPREGARFPAGYRLLIPEILRVLGETAIPALLEDPKLAALANSKRLSETATQADQGDMETAVTEVLLDPISVAARMKLGTLFEARGFNRHAQEQYAAVADLTDN
ncbi:MAG TPA: glycosyltransferase 61 family protein [Solirubrobacterales bacterium]|nr:glycosyltransferase 61 family protein [Solirubrobacterales bacterium]